LRDRLLGVAGSHLLVLSNVISEIGICVSVRGRTAIPVEDISGAGIC
jgi:hypothetical protein